MTYEHLTIGREWLGVNTVQEDAFLDQQSTEGWELVTSEFITKHEKEGGPGNTCFLYTFRYVFRRRVETVWETTSVCVSACSGATDAAMQKRADTLIAACDEMAKDGWELVSMNNAWFSPAPIRVILFFKRPKRVSP